MWKKIIIIALLLLLLVNIDKMKMFWKIKSNYIKKMFSFADQINIKIKIINKKLI